jgi:hypothetical protein
MKYLKIPIDDTDKFSIKKYFKAAYEFIEDALTYNNNDSSEEGMSTCASNECLNNMTNVNLDKKELDGLYDDINTTEFNSFSNTFQGTQGGSIPLNLKEHFVVTDDVNMKNIILQKMFRNAFKKNSSNSSRILIHCSMGMSRSPTIAMMYLMKKFKIPFRDTLDVMKLQRQKSQPIDSFLCELEDFETCEFNFHDDS